jgi:molecular chaperone GrpE
MDDKKKEKLPEPEMEDQLKENSTEETEEKDEKKEKTVKPKHKKEDRSEKLEQEILNLNDKYLRLYSEFDNYRKRTLREKIELSKTAASEIITSLLPVIDDLERAYSSIDPTEEAHLATKDGVGLILNKFVNILSQAGLEPINALGEDFNTDFHEAITNIPAPTPELKGKIVDVIQKGYLLGGKVIRFAKVVVGN